MKQNGHSLVVLSSFVMAMLTGAGNVLAACTGTGNICYVKLTPEGSQDCSSWANACGLQTALGQSASGDEIWVQKTGISVVGGYKPAVYDPTVLDGNRSVRFNLKAGVAMYGGFLGTEMERDERDWQSNGTQLSGNIGGGVNSHHVVWAFDANGAILDGFTIRAGDATNQTSTWQGGAGMVIYRDNPTIRNVTFTANKAYQGGAMLSLHSNPTLINVTFLGNTATVNPYSTSWGEKGGGMHIIGGNPTLINVTFRGNTADGYGGGLYNNGGSPTLTNVTFSNNSAPNGGSGLYNYDSNSLTLINTIIANGSGGGDCVNDSGASLNASSKNNLIEDSGSDACWLVDSSNGNIIGSDPNLGPLTHNSNNTAWWFPLLTGSPAIDAGTSEGAPATDQRGVSRPQGIAYDIGAYEYEAFAIVVNGAGANGGTMVAASGGSGIDATWNGTVTGGAKSSASVEPSSSHAITATANAGGFVAWSGDCDGTTGNGTDAATCTFTSVSSNKTATANFTLNSYAINDSANPAAGGSTTCTPNPVDHGGNSSCTYTANAGYTFTAWSGDCTGATCDLSNVTSAKTVTANFTLNSYAINDSANPAAGGSTTCTPNPVGHG
ncbi:MAG: right-handed parallel beta-helix repeat-containing protein, partial [Betaproteobacteria bacterium]|nr:right-handed parallel beta-helix repeat-containing protein [Betaproteobacteria bacterium]